MIKGKAKTGLYAGVAKKAIAPGDKKPLLVTIMDTCGKMLRIKEDIPNGYYVGADERGSDHVYSIFRNKQGVKILNHVIPAGKNRTNAILGRIVIELPIDMAVETAIANHDGVFKEIIGYRFDQIIFSRTFKGYYIAWQTPNKSGKGIVFIDGIAYGSNLRIIVSDEQRFPKQLNLYHSSDVSIYALHGTYMPGSQEFDISLQRGRVSHILYRVEYTKPRSALEMPQPNLYQRIVKVNETRTITYTVVPAYVNGKPFELNSLFRKSPLGNSKYRGTDNK